MGLRDKRREVEVFSLSFMDCICCGFGAVLLIFILTTGRRIDFSERDLKDLQEKVKMMERQVSAERSELEKLARAISPTNLDLKVLLEQNAADRQTATRRSETLKNLLQQTVQMRQVMQKLESDLEKLPSPDEQPIPIPEVDRRQYLTGVKLDGEGADYILFLVRTSGSMLGDTVAEAVEHLEEPDYKKREAPKWKRVVRSLQWMIASLGPEAKFQVMTFADEAAPLVSGGKDEWIVRKDKPAVRELVDKINGIVPGGSGNLERAFTTVRYMNRIPDVIILLTDGLPTTSDSQPASGPTDDDARIRFFRYAQRQLPPRVPVSVILYPMSGDPGAAALYWDMASTTRGAFVSPAKSWPDT